MTTIVFIGDSQTAVRSPVTQAQTYAQIVGAARGFGTIINAGVGGNTAADMLARFSTDVLSHSPDAISIMAGVNDNGGNNSVSVATFQSNMDAMVVAGLGEGAGVTILTPFFVRGGDWISRFQPYLDAMQTVAYNRSIPCVDVYRRLPDEYFYLNGATFDALWQDYQHPSANGHALIASLIQQPYYANACC